MKGAGVPRVSIAACARALGLRKAGTCYIGRCPSCGDGGLIMRPRKRGGVSLRCGGCQPTSVCKRLQLLGVPARDIDVGLDDYVTEVIDALEKIERDLTALRRRVPDVRLAATVIRAERNCISMRQLLGYFIGLHWSENAKQWFRLEDLWPEPGAADRKVDK